MTEGLEIEGVAPFPVEGLPEPCQTWYKIVGDLETPAVPLILLHGGPGASHDYLLPLVDLAPATPLIFYDQLGNGRSTHLPEKNGDEKFWTVELFMKELDNLIKHLGLQDRPIDVYGQSWGGVGSFHIQFSMLQQQTYPIFSLYNRGFAGRL